MINISGMLKIRWHTVHSKQLWLGGVVIQDDIGETVG